MRKLILLLGFSIVLSSCGWLNPNIMLKTDKGYAFAKNPDSTNTIDYKISANDIIEFNIYSNDGFKLVDLTSLNNSNMGYRFESGLEYLVESDGNIKLPILGRINISGKNIREAESLLEEKYAAYYIRPYVVISVINKRVIVFPGKAGDAKVIPLRNANTTLIEALALAGGMSDDGKAWMVKLIRQNNNTHDVFLIDLSKIEGIKQASMVLQANDIIYVEPRRKYATKLLQEIAPIVSLITSAFILVSYATIIAKK